EHCSERARRSIGRSCPQTADELPLSQPAAWRAATVRITGELPRPDRTEPPYDRREIRWAQSPPPGPVAPGTGAALREYPAPARDLRYAHVVYDKPASSDSLSFRQLQRRAGNFPSVAVRIHRY